jgi:hypothetical protein
MPRYSGVSDELIKPANERQQEIYEVCLQYLYDHENPQVMIKNAPLHRKATTPWPFGRGTA